MHALFIIVMSFPLKLAGTQIPLLNQLGSNELSYKTIPRGFTPFRSSKSKSASPKQNAHPCLCSHNSETSLTGSSNAQNFSPNLDDEGSMDKNESNQAQVLTSNKTLERLRRYGISGILSYGLLNTAYYLTTFLLVWFYFAPAPGRLGYFAAVERFVKVMAMVWAGSQVTKLVRAGGALALAPFVDRGLSWFTAKFNFESQGKAFMAIVGFCFGLALLLFFVVTLLTA